MTIASAAAFKYFSGKKPGLFSNVFNAGMGRGYSVLEAIRAFEKVTGVCVPYRFGSRRAGDTEKIYASVEKTRRILGWYAELTLEDALRSAWRGNRQLSAENRRGYKC